MTKTTNLTFLEAIEAMKRGEFCESHDEIAYRVRNGSLEYWSKSLSEWQPSKFIEPDRERWSVVNDPSKPAQKESERLWREFTELFGPSMGESSRVFYRKLIDCAKAEMREEQGK